VELADEHQLAADRSAIPRAPLSLAPVGDRKAGHVIDWWFVAGMALGNLTGSFMYHVWLNRRRDRRR
jgi:hypothetical protein